MTLDFRLWIDRKKRIIAGIAALVVVSAMGFSFASPQPTDAAVDCSTVDRGPKACTGAYWQGEDPSRFKAPGAPLTFLISGCGALNINGDRIPCYHSVNGMVQILFTLVDLILGVVGALALLMFVWGGFQWLTSGGEEERVKGGTTTLRNAVIGLLIVFGAWIGVNFIVTTLTGDEAKGTLFFGTSAANKWYNANLGALCYRALTSEELACELAEPYKPVAPASTALGTSTCPAGATKPYPNDCPCNTDADCASTRCEGASIREKRCVGSGSGAAPAPASEKGVCCFVMSDGKKRSSNDLTLAECSTFLKDKMCVAKTISSTYQNFWCRRVGDPTAPGSPSPLQICWKKSGTDAATDVEKGKCGDPTPITPSCSP